MCTVTLLPSSPSSHSPRIVVNRDEKHTRAEALPPQRMAVGERNALMPIDPASGGTWVAANDAGLFAALLNLNPVQAPPVPANPISRGGVIPALMGHGLAKAAAEAAMQLDTSRMLPFRLLIIDGQEMAVVRALGAEVSFEFSPLPDEPMMFTSSGLGDHLVETPRRELFETEQIRTEETQDAFHRQRWNDRPQLSVAMHRDDARTVSRTVIAMSPDQLAMTYTPVGFDGEEGQPHRKWLRRHAEASA